MSKRKINEEISSAERAALNRLAREKKIRVVLDLPESLAEAAKSYAPNEPVESEAIKAGIVHMLRFGGLV